MQVLNPQRHPIDLWYVLLDKANDPGLKAEYATLLSPDETTRHQRLIPPDVRHQYLVSHAFVRTTLSHYADVDPRHWQFRFSAHGKPSIASPTGLPWEFNLSHTRGLAVCAVSREHVVGVDTELRTARHDCIGLARRYFHPAESAVLEGLASGPQLEAFFQYWTLKEAYLKAHGAGLSIPLDSFGFSLAPGRAPQLFLVPDSADQASQWQFAQLRLNAGYEIAIAVQLPPGGTLQVRARETVPRRWEGPWQERPERESNGWVLG